MFSPGGRSLSGVNVGEREALGQSAVWRAVNLIAGTLASLALKSYTGGSTGEARKQVPSIFDNPDPDGQTPFEWKETAFAQLILHGRCGALKVRNAAGALVALPLVPPSAFRVELPTAADSQQPSGGLWFWVTLDNNSQVKLDGDDFWYVPALSMDGKTGIGILDAGVNALGTAVAGDEAAGRSFSQGAFISGMVTPEYDDDVNDTDPVKIRQDLDRAVLGVENAGRIAVIARRLKFTPWTMTAQQAQFIESRQFSIEEISRYSGVPPHLLMQTDKQTSWGTGVDEQNRGLSKYVLGHWASRFEQRASRLLANPRWCEFDFASLERPNIAVEIDLLVKQVEAGLLTKNEARAIRNLPPLPEPAPAPAPPADDEGDDDAPPAE
ncbi:hypothetical protein ADL15_48315 [Actinoplanes awajinensis subsp. mycoplanecinus]|uniref:Phage portal protein n=2 Tax=Actinoplanes awajinensis TaxID=135946 RepID=A0A117MKJ2_9ACTN|nr:hypothetical protein ADL15_48315 [Actinoplanes awajinensis subsp. mycoplanecinus]